jgi:hypothetical protein
METVLVCNCCQAETRLDGHRTTQNTEAMSFCAAHMAHSEGSGFSLLLPLSEVTIRPITSLVAGTTLTGMCSGGSAHAALPDMSSLCGHVAAGVLLRLGQRRGDVPIADRCPFRHALT